MPLHFPDIHIPTHPLRPVRLFLDTEFTEFGVPDKSAAKLISLALVDEHGRRFYTECQGWDESDCSTFVREHVVPHLEHRAEPAQSAANRLKSFLREYDFVVVHCDYHGDWDWLLWLLEQSSDGQEWPAALHHEPYLVDVRDWSSNAVLAGESALRRWRAEYPQHHAFYDANGLRYVWQSICVALGGVDDPSAPVASQHQCA